MPFHLGSVTFTSDQLWALVREHLEVEEELNQGRDGTVILRALHKSTSNPVALKVIKITDLKKREAVAREARLVHKAEHKNVVGYLGQFEGSSEVVLVFECCATDLLDKLNRNGRFNETQARSVFVQMVKGLLHCHSLGIAHRDVKLENVFETVEGVVKLGDFGFAATYEKGELFKNSCGTLSYAAPEVFGTRGKMEIQPEAADVWSLGVALYTLVCGAMPFDGPDDLSIVQSIRRAYPLIPTRLSDPLRKLLRSMLSVHPALRPTLRQLLGHPWTMDTAAGECMRRSSDTKRFELSITGERRSSAMLESPSGSPPGSQAGVAVAQPCAPTTARLIESPALARISYMELAPVK